MSRTSLLLLAALAPSLASAYPAVVLRQHDALAVSPHGDRLVDVEAIDPGDLPKEAHGAVVLRDGTGKILQQYDPCPTCKYSDTAWSPRGDTFAFVGADFKAGKASVYLVEHGVAKELATLEGTANTLRFAPDGARLALLATLGAHKKTGAVEAGAPMVGEIGESQDEQRIGTLALVAGAAFEAVSPADTYVYEFDWTPEGKGFVATAARGNGDNNWWVAKLVQVGADGSLRTIAAPALQMDLPRVSPDGKTVAFVGGLMSDWGAIGGDVWTVPIDGGEPTDITADFKGTFRALAWRGSRLLSAALVDDRSAIVEIDPATRATHTHWSALQRTQAQDFDGAVVFDAAGKQAASIVNDFTHAPEIALGTIDKLVPITHENAALAANVTARSVHWSNEGFHAQGWLLGPKHIEPGRKYPMIVLVHGGPSSAVPPRYIAAGGQHGNEFDFVYALVQRGYYAFYPNPRGSYGQGEAFTRANVRDFGRGDLRDILAGIDAVEKIAPVDDARLGAYGHSYGGWMTMWANTQTRRFKAIVSGAGIANWTSYYGENGIDQWMIPFFGASVYDDPAAYRAASPIEFIKQAKTPTLIYVGERDVECPAPQSQEYWHALKALGTPTQLVIYAGEGHHFRDPQHLQDLRTRIVDWYERYLK